MRVDVHAHIAVKEYLPRTAVELEAVGAENPERSLTIDAIVADDHGVVHIDVCGSRMQFVTAVGVDGNWSLQCKPPRLRIEHAARCEGADPGAILERNVALYIPECRTLCIAFVL